MEQKTEQIKAIADQTRVKILNLLLRQRLCVRALSHRLEITEAATSQHLSVLYKSGLLTKEKKGYYMHYDVNRVMLDELSQYFKELSKIQRENCNKKECGNEHCNCKKS